MNKQLLIVLLAVCLVSTHAFVKRDVPTATDIQAQLDILKANADQILKQINEELGKNLNPDVIKQNINQIVDATNKVVTSFTATTETAKSAA